MFWFFIIKLENIIKIFVVTFSLDERFFCHIQQTTPISCFNFTNDGSIGIKVRISIWNFNKNKFEFDQNQLRGKINNYIFI